MATLGAARMEQQIVKVPQHEGVVAFVRPQAAVAGVDPKKDLAVDEQAEKLGSHKIFLPAQLFDLLRRGQRNQGGRDLGIAYLEQGAGARRFQNHLVGAPPHIGKPRQHERVGVVDL